VTQFHVSNRPPTATDDAGRAEQRDVSQTEEPTTVRFAILFAIGLVPQTAFHGLPPIGRHQVGPVAIGAAAQKIYEMFPADRRELVDLGYEGILSPALLLRFVGTSQRDGVVAELVAGPTGLTVWRVEIRDPHFRTLMGVGAGSTVGELRAAYRLDSVLAGEGNVVIRVEELSASFVLDQNGPHGEQLRHVRNPAAVPDSALIKSVLLTR
jgi:hypothetical protein